MAGGSGGFAVLLGGEGKGAAEGDEEDGDRAAALEAVKRFRSAKSDEEALAAFMSLCRYAKDQHSGGDKKPDDEDEGEY